MNKTTSLIKKISREKTFLLGRIFGRKDHSKLVIVSRSRSGSNLLCSYLESHPDCFMWREVFRKPQYFTPWLTNFMIQGKYLSKFKLVGYKVFYYHKVPNNHWENLVNDSDTFIIHLVRENYLNTYLSQREAAASAEWESFDAVKSTDIVAKPKLLIDTDDMLAFLDRNHRLIDDMDVRLQNRKNVLRITYEEMVKLGGFEQVSSFLSKALDVTKYGIPVNKRQSHLPLKDRLVNFEEVKTALENSPWKSLAQLMG